MIRVVPKDLQAYLDGRKQIWRSLGTKDYGEAKAAYFAKSGEIEALFEAARKQRDADPSKNAKPLTKAEALRLVRRYVSEREEDYINVGPLADKDAIENQRDDARLTINALEDPSDPNHGRFIQDAVGQVLAMTEKTVTSDSPEGDILTEYVRLALLELYGRRLHRLDGDKTYTHVDTLFGPNAKADAKTLKEVAEDWFAEYVKTTDIKQKRRAKVRSGLNLILEYFGEGRPITDLNLARCKSFRDDLNKLPPNWRKKFPKKSVNQVLASCPSPAAWGFHTKRKARLSAT